MRTLRFALTAALLSAVALAVPVSPALAASAPSVSTNAATSVTNTTATLNGTVNPNGQLTEYAFQYGPSSSLGDETPLTSAGNGTSAEAVNADLSGLHPGTTYYFRLIALSPGGLSTGAIKSLTTTGYAPKPSTKPTVTTGEASGVSQSTATLTGTVNPNGQATTYHFEYGTTSSYGFETPATSAGNGTSAATASAAISGLAPATTYHYRLVAENAGGLTVGADRTFRTTTPPSGSTGPASNITETSATVSGTVNPRGGTTTYAFQWGTTTSYGQQTTTTSAGNGTKSLTVTATLTGLTPGTLYHYRLVTQGPGGLTYGADATFMTAAVPLSRITLIGRTAFVSPGNVLGIPAGCFYGGTRCTGKVQVHVGRSVIASRNFTLKPGTGGFVNMRLTRHGIALLRRNRPHHLLRATVTVAGAKIGTISIARWSWHG